MDGITRVHQAGSDPDHRVDGSQPAPPVLGRCSVNRLLAGQPQPQPIGQWVSPLPCRWRLGSALRLRPPSADLTHFSAVSWQLFGSGSRSGLSENRDADPALEGPIQGLISLRIRPGSGPGSGSDRVALHSVKSLLKNPSHRRTEVPDAAEKPSCDLAALGSTSAALAGCAGFSASSGAATLCALAAPQALVRWLHCWVDQAGAAGPAGWSQPAAAGRAGTGP
jgi:hypothetical protein